LLIIDKKIVDRTEESNLSEEIRTTRFTKTDDHYIVEELEPSRIDFSAAFHFFLTRKEVRD
jgi:hypothetical protein